MFDYGNFMKATRMAAELEEFILDNELRLLRVLVGEKNTHLYKIKEISLDSVGLVVHMTFDKGITERPAEIQSWIGYSELAEVIFPGAGQTEGIEELSIEQPKTIRQILHTMGYTPCDIDQMIRNGCVFVDGTQVEPTTYLCSIEGSHKISIISNKSIREYMIS